MKLYRLLRIRELGFPSALYESIVRLKPECRGKEDFRLECQPDDPDTALPLLAERIVAMCNDAGIKWTWTGEIGTYGYTIGRHYDVAELKAAPFLKMQSQHKRFRNADKRDENGRLCLPASEATSTVKLGSIFPTGWIVVSDAVRNILESAGMQGMQFGEVVIRGKSINAASKPFWELSSHLRLPKMVNSGPIRDTGCSYITEPPYQYGEPHYRQSEMQAVGGTDIALTFEQFGATPSLVISQRFYQFCLKNKIPLEVLPVRIDPD